MLRLLKSSGYAAHELISINAESASPAYLMLKFEMTVPVQKADPSKVRLFVGRNAPFGGTLSPCSRRKVEFTGVGIVATLRHAPRVRPKALTWF